MQERVSGLESLLQGTVRLLIADDDPTINEILGNLFTSPLFAVYGAASFSEAVKLLQNPGQRWHLWISDMDFGDGHSGLELMRMQEGFPFVIILSGLRSMSLAAEAMKLGAVAVFDKPVPLERLRDEACRIAALGYVLDGKTSQYLPLYRLLSTEVITTAEAWARRACVGVRQLHRICELHPQKTPRMSLALYYALYYLLWKGDTVGEDGLPPLLTEADRAFLHDCLSLVSKRFSSPEEQL